MSDIAAIQSRIMVSETEIRKLQSSFRMFIDADPSAADIDNARNRIGIDLQACRDTLKALEIQAQVARTEISNYTEKSDNLLQTTIPQLDSEIKRLNMTLEVAKKRKSERMDINACAESITTGRLSRRFTNGIKWPTSKATGQRYAAYPKTAATMQKELDIILGKIAAEEAEALNLQSKILKREQWVEDIVKELHSRKEDLVSSLMSESDESDDEDQPETEATEATNAVDDADDASQLSEKEDTEMEETEREGTEITDSVATDDDAEDEEMNDADSS
ncbi:hypothetical protein CANCADRAFT_73260 [Tortispora caseinolytica NRRL Y-17796]|uniref:Uncharacterized protein n=1 Tax=Tortispora caseinolytica NRRL Y-17796 TaxID=767744 RepID=A0A1E4TIL1_9ASCO|nr:hypothetical protein CANCADRAFT_73260 [Tortispora caseinolytica NRRL Y-17796]